MIELLYNPWEWYVAGPLIALTMFLLLLFGENFGVSNNLRTICAASGGGRYCEFFNMNWKTQLWNIVFVLGAIAGGFIASNYLSSSESMELASATVTELTKLGIDEPGKSYLPDEIFGVEAWSSLKGLSILIAGGFLVGFGARYAGGCTSGHAISGLSDLQLPSLIAVIGFFIGGLFMVYFLMPLIF